MIMAEIWVKDTKHLSQIIEKIGSIEGVNKICPAIILEKLKEMSKNRQIISSKIFFNDYLGNF